MVVSIAANFCMPKASLVQRRANYKGHFLFFMQEQRAISNKRYQLFTLLPNRLGFQEAKKSYTAFEQRAKIIWWNVDISVQRIWLNTFGTKKNKPIFIPFPQFLNNMGSLEKYKYHNWKLRWEKPLNSSYLALPNQKILPCKSSCFWECWETTLGPLPPWLKSAVLRQQELNIWRRAASTDAGLVSILLMLETWCIYIVYIAQSQLL